MRSGGDPPQSSSAARGARVLRSLAPDSSHVALLSFVTIVGTLAKRGFIATFEPALGDTVGLRDNAITSVGERWLECDGDTRASPPRHEEGMGTFGTDIAQAADRASRDTGKFKRANSP